MTSAVIQFLVAGALVVAWTWMLGRPLLTHLAERKRRGSSGSAVFSAPTASSARDRTGRGSPDGAAWPWWTVPVLAPVAEWRAQPLEKRRLQIMLGFALATFCSALLAIALRGSFIRLFLLTAACFGLHLIVAAYIGSRELRLAEVARRDRATEAAGMEVPAGAVAAEDEIDLLSGNGIGDGLFDEGFFEPIAELGPHTIDGLPATAERSIFDPIPAIDEPAPTPAGKPEAPKQPVEEKVVAAEATPGLNADIDDEPTFTAPPARRARPPRRDKARPIYIEPPAAEGDGSNRAVND